ncbi:MAG: tRNA uridine-5-carboxymethylaminomethyl(34) synthesis GTPase MnmE [Desulfomonilaceae bacterium]|jgi:tRNA modification GTPase
MTDSFQYESDTIAASATPPGYSGIGVIRLSGPDAVRIISDIFVPLNPVDTVFPERKAVYGRLVSYKTDLANSLTIDDGLATVMRGPNSYTGEDTVEISLHGGPVIMNEALTTILRCGARLAGRGEFTRRAFLNGKLDLVQAEAVIDLIMASNPSSVEEARGRLDRKLSAEILEIIVDLTDLVAEIEAGIDFAEDVEFEFPTPGPVLKRVRDKMLRLIESGVAGRRRSEGIRVAIVGKPNVGKSTLFNSLINEDRMIATPFPGTTRDAVSENIIIDGLLFEICDTAGLRDNPDPIESEGIRRALSWMEKADILLMVIDAGAAIDKDDLSVFESCKDSPRILVLNKTDLPNVLIDLDRLPHSWPAPLKISAKTGRGIENLKKVLHERATEIMSSSGHSTALRLNQRSLLLVDSALRKIDPVLESLSSGNSPVPEILSLELAGILRDLREITGECVDEAVLDRIFERFCVGK